MAHVKMTEETVAAFIKKKKAEIVSEALDQVIWLEGEIQKLHLLADLSEGTKEEFGCGLDHLRDGYRELKDSILGLVRDGG
jgi:hypothetical protein